MSPESVQPDVEPRTLRAATEHMTVIEEAQSLFSVMTQSGSEYICDLREGVCSCPDYRNRVPEGGCKHLCRMRTKVGQVDVEALATKLERTASELEMSAEQLEQQAQDLSEEPSTLEATIERLQEVAR